jgi:hypothetical protein
MCEAIEVMTLPKKSQLAPSIGEVCPSQHVRITTQRSCTRLLTVRIFPLDLITLSLLINLQNPQNAGIIPLQVQPVPMLIWRLNCLIVQIEEDNHPARFPLPKKIPNDEENEMKKE